MAVRDRPESPPVHLPRKLAEEIIAHAREGAPEEICGVVRGRGHDAYEVVRGENIAEERIQNYTVDPQTLLLQFDFEDAGDEMMGIYHSHPVSEAYPSATDAWNAHYPDAVYFICSLEDPDAPQIRAYRMITHFLASEYDSLMDGLSYYETRPGLFANYIATESEQTLLPLKLDVETPFYLVYHAPMESSEPAELRAVTVVEYSVVDR